MSARDVGGGSKDHSKEADPVGRAFERHQARVEEVLIAGDSNSIKQLYVEFGELLESAVGAEIERVPVLSFPENAPTIAPLLRDIEGWILDAGCGPAPVVGLLLGANRKRKIVAVDIGVGMVRLALARAALEGVAMTGVVADLESLPFRSQIFDGVACDDTIEHVPDDAAAIRELARVMRPAGRLVLATPNRRRLDVLRRRWRDTRRGRLREDKDYYAATSHLREYTWKSLKRLVADRFVVRRRVTVGWTGTWRHRLASVLVRFPTLRRWGRMIIFVLEPR